MDLAVALNQPGRPSAMGPKPLETTNLYFSPFTLFPFHRDLNSNM